MVIHKPPTFTRTGSHSLSAVDAESFAWGRPPSNVIKMGNGHTSPTFVRGRWTALEVPAASRPALTTPFLMPAPHQALPATDNAWTRVAITWFRLTNRDHNPALLHAALQQTLTVGLAPT